MSVSQTKQHGITKKIIFRTLLILSIITAVEIFVALVWGQVLPRWFLNPFFIILSLAKAFYIVAEFMHMKYEIKRFVYYTIFPLALLLWFILSMMIEGDYWFWLRNIF